MRNLRTAWLLGIVAAMAAGAVAADPCKAIPDQGPLPPGLHRGAEFSGRVSYVGDGDSLCVARDPSPQDWVEVRLEDFYAPELHDPAGPAAKRALSDIAFGKAVTCRADHQSHDRIVATCYRDGQSLGNLLRARGAVEGGRAYPASRRR